MLYRKTEKWAAVGIIQIMVSGFRFCFVFHSEVPPSHEIGLRPSVSDVYRNGASSVFTLKGPF